MREKCNNLSVTLQQPPPKKTFSHRRNHFSIVSLHSDTMATKQRE